MRKGLLILVSASLIGGCAPTSSRIAASSADSSRRARRRNSGICNRARNLRGCCRGWQRLRAVSRGQDVRERPGHGQDYAQAARWYAAASEAGHPQARRALAKLREQGQGVERDDAAALALYRRSAATGDLAAAFKVGQFLEQGRGTELIPAAAAEYYREAAGRSFRRAAGARETVRYGQGRPQRPCRSRALVCYGSPGSDRGGRGRARPRTEELGKLLVAAAACPRTSNAASHCSRPRPGRGGPAHRSDRQSGGRGR